MPFPTGTSDTFILNDELDNPPPVLSEKRFNKEIHDRIYTYALAHWSNLIQDPSSEAYRKNCTTYEEFYRGALDPIKINDEFELEQVNLIELFMQVKHGQLLNDRLKVHYVARKNSDWQFSNAMSQLFDWHGTQIRRDRLQHRIELCAPLFGTVPVMFIPKTRWQGGEKIMIPADYEYLDPRTTYYESRWDRDEDIPVFMIRTVSIGRLEDQIHRKLLKKRGLEKFARGNEFSKNKDIEGIVSLDSVEYEFTNDWLARISEQDVEVIRVWVKDYTTENVDIYFPTVVNAATGELGDMTPDIQASMQYASEELIDIVMTGKLPAEDEHHYSHLMQHLQDREQNEGMLDDIQQAYLDTHIEATKELFKTQPPDRVDKDIPKFKNNWRYIKIIGDQVVADGSSELDFPIAFFHNRINPGSFISISDLDNLINMQDAFNRIYSDEIMNSYQNTYSTRLLPRSMEDSENRKDGPFAEWFFDDLNELAACRNLDAPAGNASNRELMMILVQFMEMVSGGSESARGEYPKKRTAASGIMALQQQSAKRFNATQLNMNDGWTQSARIWLNQIKKYWQGKQFIPAISPDYREGITVLMDSVDPTAHLNIERIPQDLDYKEQQGNAALQIGMFAMQGGVGFEDVETMLATQYDGSTVSRVMKQLQQIRMANPEGRMRMQMQQDQQLMNAQGGGNKQ